MKKKKLLTLTGSICLVLVLVALLLPACAKEEAPVTPTPARPTPVAPTPVTPTPTPAEWEWPAKYVIVSVGLGTGGHATTAAWTPVLEETTGMKVRVVPLETEAVRYEEWVRGKYDAHGYAVGEMRMAVLGLSGYVDKDKHQIRAMWNLSDAPWGVFVRGDSELKSIYDLKKKEGLRVCWPMQSGAMMTTVTGILEGLGIAKEDVILVPFGSYGESLRCVAEGTVDVAYGATFSAVTYEIEGAPRGIRWLDMPLEDKKFWEALMKKRPAIVPGAIGWGVPSSIGHIGYTLNLLYWVLPEVDQELVYHLAKWFDENYDAYKETHSGCVRLHIDMFRSFLDFSPFPVAEGTIRYLKEVGKWTASDDKWNSEAIEKIAKYVKAWDAATAEATAKGIAIDYKSEEWVELWASHTAGLPDFTARLE